MRLPFLTERRVGDHFELFFAWRDATHTDSNPTHGVRDERYVEVCFDALERAFAKLLAPPFCLPLPSGKITVNLLDIASFFFSANPFTSEGPLGDPYIAIPSRTDAPTREEEYRELRASAVHEVFHALAWRLHSPRGIGPDLWQWYHEGCAVWAETQILPEVRDYLRYGAPWCDGPEVPLDDARMWYGNVFFVRYLAKRCGPSLIGRTWAIAAGPHDTPWEALRSCMSGDEWSGLLEDYFKDAFLIDDPTSAAYSPDLAERYANRAVSGVITLDEGGSETISGRLNHLSCRYYFVDAPARPLFTLSGPSPPIHASLHEYNGDTSNTLLCRRWLLVVSNTGTLPSDRMPAYTVVVSIPAVASFGEAASQP